MLCKRAVRSCIYIFYNELLDFNGNSIMKELPDYTLNYRDIGQSNYLGISNGAIFLKGISQAFIESLGKVETRIFDWYLYSRLLLNEKKEKRLMGVILIIEYMKLI